VSNVVQMSRSCEYLVSRAARHRRAGRYDEAMALLSRARDQFGVQEEIEMETAYVYDAIGCEEEAARCYLRVVRTHGQYKAEALFHLSVSAMQRGDMMRAAAYYQQFSSMKKSTVSHEMSALLGRQIHEELTKPIALGRRGRAAAFERRAVERLHTGKTAAAKRAVVHALNLRENAQRYTLLACCCLLRGEIREAISAAEVGGISKVTVVVGYPYEERVFDNAERLAVSRMSLSADLLSTVVLEQIYRAYKIINGETYHNGFMFLKENPRFYFRIPNDFQISSFSVSGEAMQNMSISENYTALRLFIMMRKILKKLHLIK